MGIEYRGVVCVGYNHEQMENLMEEVEYEEGVYEFYDSHNLESFSPYYDADSEDCIYGVVVAKSGDYQHKEVSGLDSKIVEAQAKLLKQFGIQPKAYLMAHGW